MEEFHIGSSSITRIELHVSYKVKYCHKVFDITEFKNRCEEIFRAAAENLKVIIKEMSFDGDTTIIRNYMKNHGAGRKEIFLKSSQNRYHWSIEKR